MEHPMTRRSFRDRQREAKNVTFALPADLLRQVDAAVATGAAPNKTALVERALTRELALVRRLARRALLEEATRDPLFARDLSDVGRDFAISDAETAREIV